MGKRAKLTAAFCCVSLFLSTTAAMAGGPQQGIRFEEIGAKAGVRVRHHSRVFH